MVRAVCLDVARTALHPFRRAGDPSGLPALPNVGFTDDMDQAIASAAKLGGLAFETLLVGHGDPIDGGASAAVAQLVAQP
jgi:hypothetical protein